jgi:hypothetical protein
MQTLIIAGVSGVAVIGLVVFLYGRSQKSLGRSEGEAESQGDAIKIRKDADEHKHKTKNSDRDTFIDM